MGILLHKVRTIEFVPASQKTLVEPAKVLTPAVEADEEKGIAAVDAVMSDPVYDVPDDASVYSFRELRRKEFMRIAELLKPDEGGEIKFNLGIAYDVVKLVLVGVSHAKIEDESGSVSDLVIELDDDGEVPQEIVDLLEPRDVFELAMEVVASAQLGISQGGK